MRRCVLELGVVWAVPTRLEQLDSPIETSFCFGISMYRCDSHWRSECCVVLDHSVTTVVVALVVDSAGWERQLLDSVILVLACLKNRSQLKMVTV